MCYLVPESPTWPHPRGYTHRRALAPGACGGGLSSAAGSAGLPRPHLGLGVAGKMRTGATHPGGQRKASRNISTTLMSTSSASTAKTTTRCTPGGRLQRRRARRTLPGGAGRRRDCGALAMAPGLSAPRAPRSRRDRAAVGLPGRPEWGGAAALSRARLLASRARRVPPRSQPSHRATDVGGAGGGAGRAGVLPAPPGAPPRWWSQ